MCFRRGAIDSTEYETVSILKLIDRRFKRTKTSLARRIKKMRFLRVVQPRVFPNRTAQDFAPEREPRRYSLQEKAFDGLSKGRAYSAGKLANLV